MKDSYLISYKLFCQRRNFSLETFIRQNKELSFSDVRDFFVKKDVEPPSKIDFINIQKKIQLENIPVIEEVILEKEVVVPKKQTTKRRRRRKSKND